MIFKKLTSIIICFCLVCSVMLAAVSCGNDERTTDAPSDTSSEVPTNGQTDESTKDPTPVPTEPSTDDNVDKAEERKVFVKDSFDDAPIPGITVELYNRSEELITGTSTNQDGVATFTVPDALYVVRLSGVPDNYSNDDAYTFDASSRELYIKLYDASNYVMDGRDEDHSLIVFDKSEITVGAGQTLYLSSSRTPGYILTLNNADGLKVVYNEKEYVAEDGVIVVEFAEQGLGSTYSLPNYFSIINNADTDYSETISILSKNAGQNRDNPFKLVIGENTTPAFVPGTSSTDPGVTTYYYEFVAEEGGVLSITTDNAIVSIYLNGEDSPLVDDNYELVHTVELSQYDNVIITVENPDLETTPVSFNVSFA